MSILIRNVSLNGNITDIALEGNRIRKIAPGIRGTFDTVIDGIGRAAIPPFYNTHTHAAMTFLRGYADDMELFEWLTKHIWPAESRLTAEDIYWGTRLACMEMIRSGTVFFNDMYFHPMETVRAVEDSGIRACIGLIALDGNPESSAKARKDNDEVWERRKEFSSRILLALAPHAVYTVREKTLREMGERLASEKELFCHIHLSETAKEVEDCRKEHGCSPVEYADRTGCLTSRTLAAHAVHLSDRDREILSNGKCTLSFNPCSNIKLCSGHFAFRKNYEAGIRIAMGTDGCASNNSLSMFDEMKAGALVAKMAENSPAAGRADRILKAATESGAEAFGLDAGVLAEGKLADLVLIDLNAPMMTPCHNLTSNLVYSADSSCVTDVICDGRILMRNRVIPGMDEVLKEASRCARHLIG